MEWLANRGRLQCCNKLSTIRQRLEAVEDLTKRKMEDMKCRINEESNVRRNKEALLTVSLMQLVQEKEKATALEKTVTDAVSQNLQQSTQIQKLEIIKTDLQEMILEEQRLRDEAMQNVSELQLQLQKMTMKVHEVEGQLRDMESKWVITPVQSYSGKPRVRSFSADQVFVQKCIKPCICSRISLACGVNRRSTKQGRYSILKHLRYFTSPKGRNKILKSRRSTGQICSVAVSPLVASTPEAKVVESPNYRKTAKRSVTEVPQTSAVKAAVQKFEKLSPRVITKGAVPKRKLFQTSKQEKEIVSNKPHGATLNAVPSSHPPPDVTDEAKEYKRSTKRCLSPSVCGDRLKKLRADKLKPLLPH